MIEAEIDADLPTLLSSHAIGRPPNFRPGISSATFAYLGAYTWTRAIRWLRRKHHRSTVKELRRRYCGGGWWPGTPERQLFNPANALPIPGHSGPNSVAGRGTTSRTNHDGTC